MTQGTPRKPPNRLSYQGGQLKFRASYARAMPTPDLYHRLLRMRWSRLLSLALALYVLVNATFALLYMLGGDSVAGARAFGDYFQFSLHTLSTIGYGNMTAKTTWAEVLVLLESFLGLGMVAVGTGVVFARFARPTSRVAFSRVMVVHQRDGAPYLVFRMANERGNQIVEARLSVSVLVDEVSAEGYHMRRFHDLTLERSQTPMFALSWMAMHRLDASSPLYGLSAEGASSRFISIMALFTGIDDTFAQSVHARHIYVPDDLRFGAVFVDMIDTDKDGLLMIHYESLHEIAPERRAVSA
jgi:inward rectifier potassium channel